MPKKSKKSKKKPSLKHYGQNYRLVNIALGLCPVCRRPASPRAKKSKLCEKHINYQRDLMRKRLGVKRPQLNEQDWVKLDWGLATPLLAKMIGYSEITIERKRLKYTPAYRRRQPRQ